MVEQDHDRLIEVSWGGGIAESIYPADLLIVAQDRPGLMKDVSEVFQREKVHITGINSQFVKGDQHMRFAVEVKGGECFRLAAFEGCLSRVIAARRAGHQTAAHRIRGGLLHLMLRSEEKPISFLSIENNEKLKYERCEE